MGEPGSAELQHIQSSSERQAAPQCVSSIWPRRWVDGVDRCAPRERGPCASQRAYHRALAAEVCHQGRAEAGHRPSPPARVGMSLRDKKLFDFTHMQAVLHREDRQHADTRPSHWIELARRMGRADTSRLPREAGKRDSRSSTQHNMQRTATWGEWAQYSRRASHDPSRPFPHRPWAYRPRAQRRETEGAPPRSQHTSSASKL